jgi:vacuolar-type H+-ATPase subunit F/Vma7
LPRIVGILREDAAAGLSLTGIDVVPVADAAEFKRGLLAAVESRETGLVIADEAMLAALDDRTRATIAARSLPLIVPVPADMRWKDLEEIPADDYVATLVRRAVGYQLNIQL